MMDRDGIEALVDVTFEVESNRLRRAVTSALYVAGVSVAAAFGDLATLSTGRFNPSHRFAVADVSLADSVVTFDPQVGDEPAVGVPGSTLLVSPNAGADTDVTVVGRTGWRCGAFLVATFAVTSTALPSAQTAKPAGWSNAIVVDTGSATTLYAANKISVFPETVIGCRYVVPPSGKLDLTLVFWVTANGTATVRPTVQTFWSGGSAWPGGFQTKIAGGAGLQQPTRVVYTFTIPAPPGTVITGIRPYVDVAGSTDTATRVEVTGVQVYAGPERSDDDGRLASAPVDETIVEQTWADSRRVNRVDLSGELRIGRITAATVQIRPTVAGAWVSVAHAAAPGRLSIDLDATYDTFGVRVIVEETSSGEGGRVWVSEVDPQYVRDVSASVVSLELETSRETDPGTSTTPVGNYEASTLTLELEDTVGDWDPAKNAALDVGHRIEVATGVRYTNMSGNPVADKDLTGWAGSGAQAIVRTVLGVSAPAETGVTNAQPAGTDPMIYTPAVFAAESTLRRLGLWTRYDGHDDGYAEVSAVVWAASPDALKSGGLEVTPALNMPKVTRRQGWQYVELAVVMPVGYSFVALRSKGTRGSASTVLQTVSATRHLSMGYNGATVDTGEIEVEELLPAGVFYSEPYDTDSLSTTVQIVAVDKLARVKESSVEEGVRFGQSVAVIVQDLALRLLDFDEDQLRVAAATAAYSIPYAYPSGDLGSYLADLAKATLSTLYVDPLETLVVEPRAAGDDVISEEIRADNSLISFKRPPGYDSTTSRVTVNASPLTPAGVVGELWAMPSGGVRIPVSASITLECPFSSVPAVNAYVDGMVADGTVTVTSTTFYADRAIVVLTNPSAVQERVVADLRVSGYALIEQPLSTTLSDVASVNRYGPRTLTIDAKLIQTQAQLDTVADVALQTFRALDVNGQRRIPDLSIESLALLHLAPGDRVLIQHPDRGVGSEYVLLSRKLRYEDGAITFADTRLREAAAGRWAVADTSIADDVFIAAY